MEKAIGSSQRNHYLEKRHGKTGEKHCLMDEVRHIELRPNVLVGDPRCGIKRDHRNQHGNRGLPQQQSTRHGLASVSAFFSSMFPIVADPAGRGPAMSGRSGCNPRLEHSPSHLSAPLSPEAPPPRLLS